MPPTSTAATVTLFVVSVTVMAFFTTSAANRIEKMESPNMQMVASLTLISSFVLVALLGWLLVVGDALDGQPELYRPMQFVFAAFISLGVVLLFDQFDKIDEYYEDPDFSFFWTLLGGVVVALVYAMFLLASPGSV